jgi:hypothetical protein
MRRVCRSLCVVAALCLPSTALAGGGTYTVVGGTASQQAQVHRALDASSFDWGVVPAVRIHVAPNAVTEAAPGEIWIDSHILDMGRFGWATVQHEYAHQIDFLLFDDAKRARMFDLVGGRDWCWGGAGLEHSDFGCERFASTVAWAYWPSRDNALRPQAPGDEAGFVPPAVFRAVLAELLGGPRPAEAPRAGVAFAPPASRLESLEP